MAEPSRVRRQLGAELKALRTLAGLTQRNLRDAAPLSQAAVSRAERGEALLSRAQMTEWLRAAGADDTARDRVWALAEAAHSETRTWPDMLAAGTPHLQGLARDRETAAAVVRNCQLTWVPGLLQTAEYARRVLAMTDIEGARDTAAAVASRVDRQQVLYQPGRRFEFLIAEAGLRWAPGPWVIAGQVDRLLSVATLATVEIGVLPVNRTGTPRVAQLHPVPAR